MLLYAEYFLAMKGMWIWFLSLCKWIGFAEFLTVEEKGTGVQPSTSQLFLWPFSYFSQYLLKSKLIIKRLQKYNFQIIKYQNIKTLHDNMTATQVHPIEAGHFLTFIICSTFYFKLMTSKMHTYARTHKWHTNTDTHKNTRESLIPSVNMSSCSEINISSSISSSRAGAVISIVDTVAFKCALLI